MSIQWIPIKKMTTNNPRNSKKNPKSGCSFKFLATELTIRFVDVHLSAGPGLKIPAKEKWAVINWI